MTDIPAVRIPQNGYVVVCDARKALVLRNDGGLRRPKLRVERVIAAPPNPPTRDQGTDRPPRVRMGDRRSAIAQTDWHALAERRFVDEVAAALDQIVDPVDDLIIVSPPRTLAHLRKALPSRLEHAVIAEIDKDLTKLPVSEIQRHLCAE